MHSVLSPHQVFDVAVFGSGLAGLSCARRLAMSGKKVVVIERSKNLGGHLLPFERSGAVFEVGLHYIADTARGSHFASALDSLGITLEQIELDTQFETLCFEDESNFAQREISYTRPAEQFALELKSKFPEKTASIEKYFATLELVWQLMRKVEFPVSVANVLKVFWHSEKKLALGKLAFQTLGDFFDELEIFGKLREILSVHHVLIGVPPSKVSAVLHMVVQRYYFENACFVVGGGRAMINALMHRDVEYISNCEASFQRIHSTTGQEEGARFRVTTLDGREMLTRNIVWTPDPRLLESHARNICLPTLMREKLKRAESPHALVVGWEP